MPQVFAPNDPSIPDLLRARIEGWNDRPPKTQFHQYGPLNAYFSINFPPVRFLVKPQALLRELWDTTNLEVEDVEALRSIILRTEDETMDIDDEVKADIKRRASIDSQGALVHVDKCHYPDFVVTAYGPGGVYGEDEDVIRLVVEVGSLGRDLRPPSKEDKDNVVKQLNRYLLVMGKMGFRWADKAVGMCIIGTEVAIVKSKSNGQFQKTVTWDSLYSAKFTDTIRQLAAM
ncbi:hypothetical protein BDZ97DRAFT_1914421 [Flammula alnicola]|nr:hypothetical protein BDZ97DRAFT_1914421 [Flammula alnicola]